MLVPVGSLEECDKEHRPPQHRMQRYALEKAMQRVRPPLGEVRAEAVSSHILHLVFVGQRWDSALGVVLRQLFPQEDKVCEAAADGEFGLLEGLEVGLGIICELHGGPRLLRARIPTLVVIW